MSFLRVFAFGSLGLSCIGAANVGTTLGWHGHNHSAHASAATSTGFGTAFSRVFTKYDELPQGESALNSAGWTKHSGCDSTLGYTWTKRSTLQGSEPLKLYTNSAGQPSGIGTFMTGYFPASQQKWCTKNPTVTHPAASVCAVDVAFRSGNQCTSSLRAEAIGDLLRVNPKASGSASDESKDIPLTDSGAGQANWQKGSCFSTMGYHRFFNTAGKKLPMTAGKWNKDDVFPVVAMYTPNQNEKGKSYGSKAGTINAIFFATPVPQSSSKQWEPTTLNNYMMCKNMCGTCDFTTSVDYATMHIYFNDVKTITCPRDTKCFVPKFLGGWGCCGGAESPALLSSDEESSDYTPNLVADGQPWAVLSGGLGLLVGVAVTCVALRKRGNSGLVAREVQISEMNTAT